MIDISPEYADWFSLEWFYPSTLRQFHWENIFFLYLLPVIPFLLLLRWAFYFRFRQKFDIALLNKDIKRWDLIGLLRFVPYIFMVLFECLILMSLARPQKIQDNVEQVSQGIDIMILMDISESMLLEDFKPNRLESAKNVARDFIKGRTTDKIGLIVFAGEAYSLAPLTTDYELLHTFIHDIKSDMIHSSGTALGDALGVGINRLRDSKNKTKVMILLSDGDNTAGSLDPVMSAKLAHAYGIKVYSIGIGKDGMALYGNNLIETSLNESTLRKIAEAAEGKFFRASNISALKDIFRMIDRFEKGEIKETRFRNTEDFYQIYLIWAIIFFLFWLLLKVTFLSNALED
ncbi:MAG: VWA domain-containing protein [Cytophagaceae bacterium]|nr:VWA domain-containing protein [Cytophagaceae bacterium]